MMPAFSTSVNFFLLFRQTILMSWRSRRALESSGYSWGKEESPPGRSLVADAAGKTGHDVCAGPGADIEVGEVDRYEPGLRRWGRTLNRETVQRCAQRPFS